MEMRKTGTPLHVNIAPAIPITFVVCDRTTDIDMILCQLAYSQLDKKADRTARHQFQAELRGDVGL